MKYFENMIMIIFIRRIFDFFHYENRENFGDICVIYENFDVYYNKKY